MYTYSYTRTRKPLTLGPVESDDYVLVIEYLYFANSGVLNNNLPVVNLLYIRITKNSKRISTSFASTLLSCVNFVKRKDLIKNERDCERGYTRMRLLNQNMRGTKWLAGYRNRRPEQKTWNGASNFIVLLVWWSDQRWSSSSGDLNGAEWWWLMVCTKCESLERNEMVLQKPMCAHTGFLNALVSESGDECCLEESYKKRRVNQLLNVAQWV